MDNKIRRKRLFIIGMVLITIGLLALIPLYFISLPKENVQILSMGIGVVLGWGSMAVSFYFGTTDGNDKES